MKHLVKLILLLPYICLSQDTIEFSHPDTNLYLDAYTYEDNGWTELLKVKKDAYFIYHNDSATFTFDVQNNQKTTEYTSTFLDNKHTGQYEGLKKSGIWKYTVNSILQTEINYKEGDTTYNYFVYSKRKNCIYDANICMKKVEIKPIRALRNICRKHNLILKYYDVGLTNNKEELIYSFDIKAPEIDSSTMVITFHLYLVPKNIQLCSFTSYGDKTIFFKETKNFNVWLSASPKNITNLSKQLNEVFEYKITNL